MKRKAVIAAIVLVLAMLCAAVAFADDGDAPVLIAPSPTGNGTLEIVKTIPTDGEGGKQPANLAVKIVFDEDMSDENNDRTNASCVKITDPEGKAQSFKLVHHEKYPDELWFVLEDTLASDTKYTVTVSAGIKASSGNTLPAATSFSFNTRDTKIDNKITLAMTMIMMLLMVFLTARSTKKQAAEKAGKKPIEKEKLSQADPYRLSKEKGITVEEAKALIAKEKTKINKKNAENEKAKEKYLEKQAEMEAEIQKRLQMLHDASVYKVKTKGSLKEHGIALPKSVVKMLAARKKNNK